MRVHLRLKPTMASPSQKQLAALGNEDLASVSCVRRDRRPTAPTGVASTAKPTVREAELCFAASADRVAGSFPFPIVTRRLGWPIRSWNFPTATPHQMTSTTPNGPARQSL